jgi:hypothetical protein
LVRGGRGRELVSLLIREANVTFERGLIRNQETEFGVQKISDP